MNIKYASHFRQPRGLRGWYISRVMIKWNDFVYKNIEKHGRFEKGMEVFEIGYGPGTGIKYLLSKHDIIIDGIDFSELMFNQCRRRNNKSIKAKKLNLMYGDFTNFEPNDRLYDRVIFSNVSYFWKELSPQFLKIKKMLKNEGSLVFYMTSGEKLKQAEFSSVDLFNHHSLEDVLKSMSKCGYKEIKTHNVNDDSGDFMIIEGSN